MTGGTSQMYRIFTNRTPELKAAAHHLNVMVFKQMAVYLTPHSQQYMQLVQKTKNDQRVYYNTVPTTSMDCKLTD